MSGNCDILLNFDILLGITFPSDYMFIIVYLSVKRLYGYQDIVIIVIIQDFSQFTELKGSVFLYSVL